MGTEACPEGPFKDQHCTDLAGRVLVGSYGSYKQLNTYEATFPDHHHPHDHPSTSHTHEVPEHDHGYKIPYNKDTHCGMGGTKCNQGYYDERVSKHAKFNVKSSSTTTPKQSTLGVQNIKKYDHQATLGDLYP